MLALERNESIVVRDDRPQVHEQVELPAHAEDHGALDDAPRRPRVADCAEEDRIVAPERIDLGGADPFAGFDVTRRRPWVFRARCGKGEPPLGRVEDAECSARYFWADAVTSDDSNGVGPGHEPWQSSQNR